MARGQRLLLTVAVAVTVIVIISEYYILVSFLDSHEDAVKETGEVQSSSQDDITRRQNLQEEVRFCPSTPKPDPFDPFTDLTFSPPPEVSPQAYSSFHCVGMGTRDHPLLQTDAGSVNGHRPNYVSRSCWYRNLYYRIADQSFHYFSSPVESNVWAEGRKAGKASFEELSSKMDVSMGHLDDGHTSDQLANKFKFTPWRPHVHENVDAPDNASFAVAGPEKTMFLLYQPFHSRNFGHLMWDDVHSLFALLDLFGLDQDDSLVHVPFFVERPDEKLGQPSTRVKNFGGSDPFWRCSPWNSVKWNKCVQTYKKFYAELLGVRPDCSGDVMRTGNWLRGEDAIGEWKDHPKEKCKDRPERTNLPPTDTEYILLPNVLAGTGRLGSGCDGDCSLGSGARYYRFRRFLLHKMFGPQRACELASKPPVGYITFSLPGNSSRPGLVYFFEEEIKLATQKYGADAVRVVDMAKMTLQEQAELVANSAVMLTNHGGGSAVSVFLPTGSGILVFWHGNSRMDHAVYESAGYLRPIWVSEAERPYVNRTMALIEREVEKTALRVPGIISARGLERIEWQKTSE